MMKAVMWTMPNGDLFTVDWCWCRSSRSYSMEEVICVYYLALARSKLLYIYFQDSICLMSVNPTIYSPLK